MIISVLAKRSNEQRQRIKVLYEAQHGEVRSLSGGSSSSQPGVLLLLLLLESTALEHK